MVNWWVVSTHGKRDLEQRALVWSEGWKADIFVKEENISWELASLLVQYWHQDPFKWSISWISGDCTDVAMCSAHHEIPDLSTSYPTPRERERERTSSLTAQSSWCHLHPCMCKWTPPLPCLWTQRRLPWVSPDLHINQEECNSWLMTQGNKWGNSG
jgi:hypothetical protein